MEKKSGFLKQVGELFANKEKEKKIQWLVFILLAGILLVVFANGFLATPASKTPGESRDLTEKSAGTASGTAVGEELEAILGKIKGVGKVKVMITYANSGKSIFATDENRIWDTEEQNTGEGKSVVRKSEESRVSVVFNGQKLPLVEDRISADIKGVLVVAEGGGDPLVKALILQAVRALTGVEAHEIAVCPYK